MSSDVYFYDVGNEFWNDYYNKPSPDRPLGESGINEEGNTPSLGLEGDLAAHPVGYGIQKTAFAFGFGKATGVGLAGDQAGRIPTRSFNVDLNKSDPDPTTRTWRRGDSASLAVGQGDVLVTPLQLANAYATFANGGTLYTPRLASAVLASGVGLPEGELGDVVHTLDPQMLRTGLLTPEIRSPILAGLIGAVNNGEGTAYFAFRELLGPDVRRARPAPPRSQNGKLDDTSWFVGFTNAENDPAQPQYVVLVDGRAGRLRRRSVGARSRRAIAEYLDRNPNPPAVHVAAPAEQEGLMRAMIATRHEPHPPRRVRARASAARRQSRSGRGSTRRRCATSTSCSSSRCSRSARSASR